MSTMISGHQSQLIQRMGGTGVADYNLTQLIRYYKNAINSADTPQLATNLAQALEGVLSNYGKSLADVQGITNPLLNNAQQATAAAGNTANAGNAGNDAGKNIDKNTMIAGVKATGDYNNPLIADLNKELGIDPKKKGSKADWAKAVKEGKIKLISGSEDLKAGSVVEVNSKQYGVVRIQIGGDGEINGGDEKILSVGGKAAANGVLDGLNQINNPNTNQVLNQAATNAAATMQAAGVNPLNAEAAINPFNQNQQQSMFSEDQIKNLLAAILNQAIYSMDQKQVM